MKAIRVQQFGEPSVLQLEEVAEPTAGAGQVVVQVQAIGVNPVETYIRAGRYGPREFPYTPGADCAGIISEVGANVSRFKPGDRVYTAGSVSGTYAELALCNQATVFALPAKVTFAQGAALGVPAATAYRALFHRARVKAGETVLIHGATGGVGVAAVQLARAFGCIVIGTGGSSEGRELVLKEGAHHVLDHHDPTYMDELLKLTGGKGVDAILEMLANVNLDKDLGALAKFGRIVVIGNRGRIEIDPRQTMAKDADIRGMTLFNVNQAELEEIHAALAAHLESGTLRPVIEQEMPLADAARAHEEVMKGESRGKIILVP